MTDAISLEVNAEREEIFHRGIRETTIGMKELTGLLTSNSFFTNKIQPAGTGLPQFRESTSLQTAIFGSSYEEFKKKGKKKKKPKPSIQVVCTSKSDCNGSCSTILDSEGKFIRCSGNCCAPGPGVWKVEEVGTSEMGLY